MSNSSQLPSVAAPSSILVLVDLRADFFLSLFSPLPLAIHIAACPSHIHWPCPGCALLVFRPVVVERYTPTWHQTATLCLSIHSAAIYLLKERLWKWKEHPVMWSFRVTWTQSVTKSRFAHWCVWQMNHWSQPDFSFGCERSDNDVL